MTHLFLDTEFNGFGGDLISMALVARDGQEWYENLGCNKPCPWVYEHVLPVINRPAVTLEKLQYSLTEWLWQFDAIHIIADWPEDIAHFCRVLITGPGMRLPTPPLTFEIVRIDAVSAIPHNALADARGIREAYYT